jgi:hypothetical protein
LAGRGDPSPPEAGEQKFMASLRCTARPCVKIAKIKGLGCAHAVEHLPSKQKKKNSKNKKNKYHMKEKKETFLGLL